MSGTLEVDRIALLLQSLEGGGAQRRVVELANGFARSGRKVDLFLDHLEGTLHDRLAAEVRTIPAAALARHLGETPPGALLSGAAAVHDLAVRSLPKERSFPLVLRASSHPFRNLPWSMPKERLIEQVRRVKRLRNYRSADLIIAVASDIAEALRIALPAKCVKVIPNQVVTPEFLSGATAVIEFPWPEEPEVPLIVAVGRLALAKDYPTLLRAFAIVRKSRRLRLAILGSGTEAERDRLLRLAGKIGIESDLCLGGDCDHVAAWLLRSNLLVSSSLWEGSPAALVEALAMGRPIVATTSVGLARELLASGELGFLVPPGRPELMAEAIARALDKTFDENRLRAAAEPFCRDRSGDYLIAIDRCASSMKDHSWKSS